ncbi:hypothetical protein LPJ73_001969 [Coemansia sp. RSA 2703]|nr:hypothetical protein LPJ73_001969 [Coemansia sp. RSA 2703]KAJ2378672.1 hypothetical protein IW150_000652 [Coemansia sp. RSA 2607]KAJ2397514.1 hypothetical protein GGI05_000604 [Coemansia sp. RSA 2603]
MLHFRLFLVSTIFAVLLALVQGVPAGASSVPSASPAALASPSVDIIVGATSSPTIAATVSPADGPAAHLTLGQVVFNFVTGMLNIVEDTVRGYLQFGPSNN